MGKLTDSEAIESVKATITDLVSDFLYYDRKEDEDLPRGHIDELVSSGALPMDTIVDWFASELRKGLQ